MDGSDRKKNCALFYSEVLLSSDAFHKIIMLFIALKVSCETVIFDNQENILRSALSMGRSEDRG